MQCSKESRLQLENWGNHNWGTKIGAIVIWVITNGAQNWGNHNWGNGFRSKIDPYTLEARVLNASRQLSQRQHDLTCICNTLGSGCFVPAPPSTTSPRALARRNTTTFCVSTSPRRHGDVTVSSSSELSSRVKDF